MKCGFTDCNNSKLKGKKDCCQSCNERKEWDICWACQKARKPQEREGKINLINSLPSIYWLTKNSYLVGRKLKELSPPQFKNEIEKIINDYKLSEDEEKLLSKLEKMILEFLSERGGKQYNSYWFNFCLGCNSEIEIRIEKFS